MILVSSVGVLQEESVATSLQTEESIQRKELFTTESELSSDRHPVEAIEASSEGPPKESNTEGLIEERTIASTEETDSSEEAVSARSTAEADGKLIELLRTWKNVTGFAKQSGEDKWTTGNIRDILHIDLTALRDNGGSTARRDYDEACTWTNIDDDLAQLTGLISFKWDNTKLETIDVSRLSNLSTLSVSQLSLKAYNKSASMIDTGNYLTEITTGTNNYSKLETLYLAQHGMRRIDLSEFDVLEDLRLGNINEGQNNIPVDGSSAVALDDELRELSKSRATLEELVLPTQGRSILKYLWISAQKLSGSLNLVGCNNLEQIQVGHNNLTEITGLTDRDGETSGNHYQELKRVRINYNLISSNLLNIKADACPNLAEVWVHNNQIVGVLKLNGLSELKDFRCQFNQITSINLIGSTKKLEVINAFSQKNPGLEYIQTDHNQGTPAALGAELADFPRIRDFALYENVVRDIVFTRYQGINMNDFSWNSTQFRLWQNKMNRFDLTALTPAERKKLNVSSVRVSLNTLSTLDLRFFEGVTRIDAAKNGSSIARERNPLKLYLKNNVALTTLNLENTRLLSAEEPLDGHGGEVEYPQLFNVNELTNLNALDVIYTEMNSETLAQIPSTKLKTIKAGMNSISDLSFLEKDNYQTSLAISGASFDFSNQLLFYPQNNDSGRFNLSNYLKPSNRTTISTWSNLLTGRSYDNRVRYSSMKPLPNNPQMNLAALTVETTEADLNQVANPTIQFDSAAASNVKFSGFITLVDDQKLLEITNNGTAMQQVDCYKKDQQYVFNYAFANTEDYYQNDNVKKFRNLSPNVLSEKEFLKIVFPDELALHGFTLNGRQYSFPAAGRPTGEYILNLAELERIMPSHAATIGNFETLELNFQLTKHLEQGERVSFDCYHSTDYSNRQMENKRLPQEAESLIWHKETWIGQTGKEFKFIKKDQGSGDVSKIASLKGVEFALYKKNQDGSAGEKLATKVSATDGTVDFGLLRPGEYYLEETKALDGYQRPTGYWRVVVPEDQRSVTVIQTNTATQPAFEKKGDEFYLINYKNKSFWFIKEDDSGDPTSKTKGNPLPGVCFTLYTLDQAGLEQPYKTATSPQNGTVSFGAIPPGDYNLRETATLEGYTLPEGHWKVQIRHYFTTYNGYGKSSLRLTPAADQAGGDMPPAFFEADGDTYYHLQNFISPKDFVFYKEDNDQNRLSGVKFELQKLNEAGQPEGNVMERISEESDDAEKGKVLFAGLPKGKYRLKETQTQKGYQLPVGYWEITVGASITIEGAGPLLPPAFRIGGENGKTLFLPNYKEYRLPQVGGKLKILILCVGVVLILSGISWGMQEKKKQRKSLG